MLTGIVGKKWAREWKSSVMLNIIEAKLIPWPGIKAYKLMNEVVMDKTLQAVERQDLGEKHC